MIATDLLDQAEQVLIDDAQHLLDSLVVDGAAA